MEQEFLENVWSSVFAAEYIRRRDGSSIMQNRELELAVDVANHAVDTLVVLCSDKIKIVGKVNV